MSTPAQPQTVRRDIDAVPALADVAVECGAWFHVDAAYMTTVQWSRRAIGLKVFMSLAERGRNGFAEQIDRQARMGDVLRAKLSNAGGRSPTTRRCR